MMARRREIGGFPKFEEGYEVQDMIEVFALPEDSEIHADMSTDNAVAIFKHHLHNLVNKYRKFKNSNKNLSRNERDWWFPIEKTTVSKKSAKYFTGRNGSAADSRELRKFYSPDLASVFGMSVSEFTILINKTNGRWKKSAAMKVPIQTRKAQSIDWILIDEDSALGKWTPDDQGRGEREIPPWINYKHGEKTDKSLLTVEECDNEEFEDENGDEEIHYGRPTGSKNKLREFTLDNGYIVALPSHYAIITKNKLSRLQKEVEMLRKRLVKEDNEIFKLKRSREVEFKSPNCRPKTKTKTIVVSNERFNRRNDRAFNEEKDDVEEVFLFHPPALQRITTTTEKFVDGLKKLTEAKLSKKSLKNRDGNSQNMLLIISAVILASLREVNTENVDIVNFHDMQLGLGRRLRENASAKLESLNGEPFQNLLETLERNIRSDAVAPKSKSFVYSYCHNDNNAHRIDSNNLEEVKVDGEESGHIVRIWENALTQEEKYADFRKSIEFQQFKSNFPTLEISKQLFFDQICPCLRDPTIRSCVDLDYSELEEYLVAMRNILKKDQETKASFISCSCPFHLRLRQAPTATCFETAVRSKPLRDILSSTFCAKIEDQEMATGSGSGRKVPKLFQATCMNGTCNNCGIDNTFQEFNECPLFKLPETWQNNFIPNPDETDTLEKVEPPSNNERVFECRVWCKVKIANSSATQMEIRTKKKTWKQLVYRLKETLQRTRHHHADLQWSKVCQDVLAQNIDPRYAISIFTDFGATADLYANAKDNSTINGHAIIDIFYILSDQKDVEYTNENGDSDVHRLTKCKIRQFIGGTNSKGKSHDWKFHGRALLDIIEEHERTREVEKDDEGAELLFTYFTITDASPSQYRCRQNFMQEIQITVEKFPTRKIRIIHMFAVKYGFKGPWDADGGRSKARLRKEEQKGNRSPNSISAYFTLMETMTKTKPNIPVEKWVENKDKRIVRKTPMMMDERKFVYISDDKNEYMKLVLENASNQNVKVLYLDRNLLSKTADPGSAVKDTMSHYNFILPFTSTGRAPNGQPLYHLEISERLCACKHCRKGAPLACTHQEYRGPLKPRKMRAKVFT